MIQVRYEFRFEDRFNISYREWLNRLSNHKKEWIMKSINYIDKENFGDGNRYISFTVNLSQELLIEYMEFLYNTEEIMGINFEFRYVYRTVNAYDAGKGMFCINWCKFI
jgi:hypothetical protein